MQTKICRLIAWFLTGVVCLVAVAVGVSSVAKYVSDKRTFDFASSYSIPANCSVRRSVVVSNNPSCVIALYTLTLLLRIPEAQNASLESASTPSPSPSPTLAVTLPPISVNATSDESGSADGDDVDAYENRYAYSNFFADACGGRLGNLTGTTISCWYYTLNDTHVRISSTDGFEPMHLYLYIGLVLVICGGAPPIVGFLACCCQLTYRMSKWLWPDAEERRAAVAPRHHAAPTTHEPVSALLDLQVPELSPTGNDWSGRLITKTDFATHAVERLKDLALFQSAEECPLCFQKFGSSVVWWTCGHCLCSECNPRVLTAEAAFGRTRMPRCPVCRERSDIADMVRVKLPHPGEGSSEVVLIAAVPEEDHNGIVAESIAVDMQPDDIGGTIEMQDNVNDIDVEETNETAAHHDDDDHDRGVTNGPDD